MVDRLLITAAFFATLAALHFIDRVSYGVSVWQAMETEIAL